MFYVLDMKYSYIIDQQPIGRLLFLQFCEEERHEFHRYNVFLDSIVSLNIIYYIGFYITYFTCYSVLLTGKI